jgi:hypothetical protein
MLNLQHIRERLRAEFRSFVIRLSDGRALSVPHPDFIAVGRGLVVVLDENDREYRLDPLHIVSVDDPDMQQSNGR